MSARHGLTPAELAEYRELTQWRDGSSLPVLTNAQIGRVAELYAKAERACWERVRNALLPVPVMS